MVVDVTPSLVISELNQRFEGNMVIREIAGSRPAAVGLIFPDSSVGRTPGC